MSAISSLLPAGMSSLALRRRPILRDARLRLPHTPRNISSSILLSSIAYAVEDIIFAAFPASPSRETYLRT